MSLTIQALPADVVHLIAAGEVIDSLAAVVRELAENSIDAGATRIVVSLWPEQWRVQVVDNGAGMDLENLRQAATAHSTSKISHKTDLYNIQTLGFRGEALHSLAQLAELEIVSRPQKKLSSENEAQDSVKSGWRVVYNQAGEPINIEAAAIAPGTIVTVSNLFGNWPVRRGFLSPTQQLRSIQFTLQQLALCHPHISWQLRQAESLFWNITPSPNAHKILPQILREVRFHDLHSLTLEIPPFDIELENFSEPQPSTLELVMGLPDRCHRRRPDWVKVAVNKRIVRVSELEQVILAAFSRTCPRDRYPICFVHLHISPHQIDWNRHPAKAEIYLHHLNDWQQHIRQGIEQGLSLNVDQIPVPLPERVGQLLKVSEEKSGYQINRSLPSTSEGEEAPDQEVALLELKAIAQVRNTYIVAEHPGGIWLVEQHIAHERVLYEQICQNWQLVPLDSPIILSHLSAMQVENLQQLEIELESFGEQLWAARKLPALLVNREDSRDALIELSKVEDLQSAQVATACRSAIRNGIPLSLTEMQTLLNQWQQTRKPHTCPHGRPIYLSLEESALSRFFRRHWVIGKSHGI